jgi:nitroimidazol reductase NimA-like FMN-containing flavoprotein (pyridoxamine 5'-phosphate oxidase superfamily)
MPQNRIPDEYRGGSEIDEPALEALAERRDAIVGTLNRDGSIHMTPVWFLYEDGCLYFETNSATRKARNVAERQALTVLVPGTDRDVIATGHGRLISGEEGMEINRRLRAKYVTEEGQGPVGRFFEQIDDVAVELKPSSVTTWSNQKLRDSMRSIPEYTPDTVAAWFYPMES